MKWIGQHIWDFISRFRSDVYLEGTETGTIASGGNLGLDANNKIVKATTGSGDLTITDAANNRIVTSGAGTVLNAETYATFTNSSDHSTFQLINNLNSAADYLTVAVGENGETDFLTVDNDAALAHMNFTADGKITMTPADINGDVFHLDANANSNNIVNIDAGTLDIDVTGNTSVDTIEFVVEHQTTGTFTVQNTGASATGGMINLKNTNNGVDANDSDYCGYVRFWGQDDGTPTLTEYGSITTQISDASSNDEAGTMRLQVRNNTGTGALLDGIAMYGNTDVDGDINVNIASGTSSVTTIAGDLDIDGDNMTSAGAMTFTPVGKYTITAPDLTGDVFHLDADTDTDNIVNIDAGALDIDTTASITIDAADDITISATDNATFRGEDDVTVSATSADGLLTLSSAHTAGTSIHIDGNENAGSIVDIDAGILDIDSTGDTAINAGSIISLESSISKINKTYNFHTTTFENQYGSGHGSGKILKYSPANDNTATAGQVYYLRDTGTWAQANAGAENTATAIMAVGLGGGAQATGLLIQGFVRVPYTEILNFPGSGNIDGAPIYLSTTNGHFDFTAPSGSTEFVRILGYAIDDYDTGSGQIDVLVYFDPDKTYIQLA